MLYVTTPIRFTSLSISLFYNDYLVIIILVSFHLCIIIVLSTRV